MQSLPPRQGYCLQKSTSADSRAKPVVGSNAQPAVDSHAKPALYSVIAAKALRVRRLGAAAAIRVTRSTPKTETTSYHAPFKPFLLCNPHGYWLPPF